VRRFARLLRETADRHGVSAQLWVPSFGLTGDDIPDLESAIAVLNQLRELGVELYMSHFGSGRLSLSSMPSFPLRGIKVDPIVVHRVGGRRADLDVVRSIMDLARSLGLRAIAEGVETVAQRERLIAFGCELGQGHLLGKPLEPKAAIALLKA